ncbi:MAG: hypothetical protein HFJ04_14050 [Lachnospiraceae bacterium]|nr:hypothetical protein [Lachnospiraceae bacterium]
METKKSESVQVASVVVEFKNNGCRDDVLRVAKEDLELGYPKELVALYAESGWQMDRCKKFSSIMRADSDRDLLRMLAEGGFNPYQMQLLANYYEKGVPVAQLRDVGAKNLTAYDMEQALKTVYQANRQAETETAGDKTEDSGLQEKIASLAEELRQSEKELEKQQETANRRAAENAELRTAADGLEKRVKELEQEKAGYDSEKRSILEERDRFYRQNQTLMEEKSRLIADLEEVQKEKDGMEQRLKEMESKALAETAEPQTAEQAGSGPGITAGQQMAEPAGNNTGDSARDDYLAAIRGRNGEKHLVPVERSVRKKPDGLKVFAEKLFGRGRQSSGLIKQLTGKGLNPAQMEQVRMAVQAGLTGQEVNDLINSGFSADEMAQAVEIVVAERAYQ